MHRLRIAIDKDHTNWRAQLYPPDWGILDDPRVTKIFALGWTSSLIGCTYAFAALTISLVLWITAAHRVLRCESRVTNPSRQS